MIGHGRPTSRARAHARVALALCALLATVASAQETTPVNEPIRLHIAWGGGDAGAWTGRVSLDKGSLSNLKLLSSDADAAGSLWIDQSQLHIADISAHKSDVVEVAANASPDATLLVELSSGPQVGPSKVQIPLADLQRRPFQQRLDALGNTLDVRVIPNSPLHIKIKGEAASGQKLIFSPGEQLSFELSPVLPAALHGTMLDIQSTLTKARRKESVWSDSQKMEVPVSGLLKADINVPLPQVEGVYTVHVAVTRPSGYFSNKFLPGASTPLAERSFQVVVLDSRPQVADAKSDAVSVLDIDPTNPRWVERLPSWTAQVRFIPGLSRGPQGSIRAGTVNLPSGRFVELPPTAASGSPHWQAYSLPLEAVGAPHILEIDYPVADEQHFGLSIVEPNAAGVVEGVYRDAGVYVEGLGRGELKQAQTHRVIFWPRTQAPLLIVTNEHPTAPAHFGQIRVLKHNGALGAGKAAAQPRGRLIAAYLSRPLAANGFGATETAETIGAGSAGSVGDALTAYESATRLTDYLRYGGYNSAVASVLADGSAIFPMSRMAFTPRYAPERLADRLLEFDSLELALSVVDRDQLTMIPALEFATPLPELEELRRAGDSRKTGLELVGPDGRTWLEANGSRGGLAPYYNLLNPRVQQAMLKLVSDLVQRYSKHPGLGGMAIQLTGDGYAQLPGPEWGLDDATFARFERDTGLKYEATGEKRFETRQQAITAPDKPYAEAWRKWRTQQVADFYARMAAVVRGNTDRRLLLTTEKLFDHPQVGRRLRPALPIEPIENRFAAAMLDLGLDRQQLEQVQGVVLCPTRYIEPMALLPDRATDLELNDAFARLRQPLNVATPAAAALYHRPQELSLASLANFRSPFRVDGDARLVSQPMPHEAAARQPYLQALASRDPAVLLEGGDSLPLGQDDSLRAVRGILAEIPASVQVVEATKQPVVVRAYSEANQVTLVVMNLSPWKADARIALDIPQTAALGPLVAPLESAIKPLMLPPGRQAWNVTLAPYDLQAVRIPVAGTKPLGVEVDLSKGAKAELVAQLADLSNRDLSAPRPYQSLANPGFEQLNAAGQPLGWKVSNGNTNSQAVLDATGAQEGKSCLYFRNTGQNAAVESDPFRMPATGQLAMTVFARGENLAPQTNLSLVFEVEQNGLTYRRTAKAPIRNAAAPGVNQTWGRPFAIMVNDLPLQSDGKMRIVFELSGPGEVWLDNVQLSDVLFSLKYYNNSQDEILQLLQQTHNAQSALEREQFSECLDLIDGYWPRFVRTYRPAAPQKVALLPVGQPGLAPPVGTQQNPDAPPVQDGEQPAPGVGDRIKRMVPIFR